MKRRNIILDRVIHKGPKYRIVKIYDDPNAKILSGLLMPEMRLIQLFVGDEYDSITEFTDNIILEKGREILGI